MEQTQDPLELYDEMLSAGRAPAPESFCRNYPQLPELLPRLQALIQLREELAGLASELRPVTAASLVGGYRVVTLLDEGGMGAVYVAQDRHGRRCALKLLRNASGLALERLTREAELLQGLDHPNVARVLDMGVDQDRAYMAVELVAGITLAELLANKIPQRKVQALQLSHLPRLPPLAERVAMCLDLAHQTALALEHAHDRGVIHRDVKPSNIMVMANGRLKLIDFGIARPLEDPLHLTASGIFVGSTPYAAPEQLEANRNAMGPWTDTFALGATLYEMLTGQRPYPDRQRPRPDALAKPSKLNRAVGRAVDALVKKALEPKPSRRFQHGRHLAEALLRVRT